MNMSIWKTFDVPNFKPYRLCIEIKSKDEETILLSSLYRAINGEKMLSPDQTAIWQQLKHCITG